MARVIASFRIDGNVAETAGVLRFPGPGNFLEEALRCMAGIGDKLAGFGFWLVDRTEATHECGFALTLVHVGARDEFAVRAPKSLRPVRLPGPPGTHGGNS